MKAEHLTLWQPQADMHKLNAFVAQNATLLALLEESWRNFDANYQDVLPTSSHEYAPDMSPDDLEHLPLSPAEMAEFLNRFDANREHNDQPFGRDVVINEQNWELLENE